MDRNRGAEPASARCTAMNKLMALSAALLLIAAPP
jgi:hypothetical protein